MPPRKSETFPSLFRLVNAMNRTQNEIKGRAGEINLHIYSQVLDILHATKLHCVCLNNDNELKNINTQKIPAIKNKGKRQWT
jgi:hypothetical protein